MARSSFGSIKPYGDGKWRVFISEGYDRKGKRVRTSKVFETKDEAERFIARKRLEKGHQVVADKNMTISDFWNASYLPMLNSLHSIGERSKSYIVTRTSHFRALDKVLGNETMDGLDQRFIERKLMEINAPNTRHGAYTLLKNMYEVAMDDGLLDSTPFTRRSRISKPKTRRQNVLSISDIASWLEGIKGFKYEAVALIIFGSGLRREEVAALSWDCIEYRNNALYITITSARTMFETRGTKTPESERVVIIAEPLASRIEALRDDGYLLKGVKSENVNPARFTNLYKEWCEAHDMKYTTPRNLRNSYATFRQATKGDPTITSKSLGHTNLRMDYDHYFVVQEEAFLNEAEKMGAALCAIMCQTDAPDENENHST